MKFLKDAFNATAFVTKALFLTGSYTAGPQVTETGLIGAFTMSASPPVAVAIGAGAIVAGIATAAFGMKEGF